MQQSAKLVAYTAPSKQSDQPNGMNVEEFIIFCARVSNPSNQNNSETAPRLLKYLVEHAHWSPLEMASATIEIITTRDIARQILRHRSFSFQEFSQRYGAVQSFHEGRAARWQDYANRQNSTPVDYNDEGQAAIADEFKRRQATSLEYARETYEWALKQGIAKEQARAVLPEGLTMSRLYMSGTIRSWFHYCSQHGGVRWAHGTQAEHVEVAHMCAEELRLICPILFSTDTFEELHFDARIEEDAKSGVLERVFAKELEKGKKESGR